MVAIADCVESFIEEWSRNDYMGNSAFTTSEIAELNIISPPEQLWYAAAQKFELSRLAAIHPQFPIQSYFADFMLDPYSFFAQQQFPFYPSEVLASLKNSCQRIVVEIDGFEWHDKTPQQAENDRRRERNIIHAGFQVVRYSAREILRDPAMSMNDIECIVQAELRRLSSRLSISWT